jgi:hypothetical protein
MTTPGLSLNALAVASVVSAVLAGCGSACSAPRPVATVDGSVISRDSLVHWQAVKRHELAAPGTPNPPSEPQLRDDALAFLVTSLWLEKEAAARGASIPMSAAEASYGQLARGPSGPLFSASLRNRGLTRADEVRLLHLAALASRLRAMLVARVPPSQANARVQAYLAAYTKRWKARTHCSTGYVISVCAGG